MAGVTILQTVTPIAGVTVLIFVCCCVVVLINLICAIICYSEKCVKAGIVFTIIAAIGIITAILNLSHPMYDKTQYQVIIDDTVSMTEFTQRYNIIEQEGITYWVTEK